jgi:hypothetical protein
MHASCLRPRVALVGFLPVSRFYWKLLDDLGPDRASPTDPFIRLHGLQATTELTTRDLDED